MVGHLGCFPVTVFGNNTVLNVFLYALRSLGPNS